MEAVKGLGLATLFGAGLLLAALTTIPAQAGRTLPEIGPVIIVDNPGSGRIVIVVEPDDEK
jgi:hypothetical protein